MPTRDRPEPPSDLDREAREALALLEDRDPDRLRAVGRYLERIADWKETDGRRAATADPDAAGGEGDDSGDRDEGDDSSDRDLEYPDGVPERAEVTVKEIAGTTYSYYQWRDGDRIESKTVQRE